MLQAPRMVVKVEVEGRKAGAIFARPQHFLAVLVALAEACDALGVGLVAFCLMTTHLHLVLRVPGPEVVALLLDRLRRTVGQRGIGLAPLGEPRVEGLTDAYAVLRTTGYVHANPVTAGMVLDPASWPWSSHRDALGLRRAVWYRPDDLIGCRAALKTADFETWLHTRSKGTFPMPRPVSLPSRPDWPVDSLDTIAESVACWHGREWSEFGRQPAGAPMRRTMMAVGRALGWDPREIGEYLGWTDRHARRADSVVRGSQIPVAPILALLFDDRLRPPRSRWLDVPLAARGANLLPNNRARQESANTHPPCPPLRTLRGTLR